MSVSCTTCALATWRLTPTGKIKRGEAGRCGYKITPPATPWWANGVRQEVASANAHPHGIWPGMDHDCEVHMPITVPA